jgi:pimeloyl-ACP methyl ester carboxylesterase
MTGFTALSQREVRLADTTIRYRDLGTGESTIVFVHGLFTNGTLWRQVVPLLTDRFRCVVPDWPLGAHTTPLAPHADASPRGIARMIADFLERLDLRDVTLVANDTGGAIAQLLVVEHPDRIARLVLTPCDAFENFLPAMFRPLQYAARLPFTLTLAVQLLRLKPLRRAPMAFGWLSKRTVPTEISDGWLRPFLTDRAIRRDTVRFLRARSTPATHSTPRQDSCPSPARYSSPGPPRTGCSRSSTPSAWHRSSLTRLLNRSPTAMPSSRKTNRNASPNSSKHSPKHPRHSTAPSSDDVHRASVS